MQYVSDIHTEPSSVWANTGFAIKRESGTGYGHCVLTFEDLNPHVHFKRVMSRGDLVRIAWWMIRQALR